MRLLRIIASMDPVSGGPCQGIRNSIPELEKLGVQNEVVCLDSPNALFLREDPFITHPLGPCTTPWRFSLKLIPWLLENLERFDAVIVHGLWLYHGYAVSKAIRVLAQRQKELKWATRTTPKIFVMPHGMLDPYFQQAPERKLKALRNWIYWKIIERKVVNDAAGLLFTCESELKLARLPFRPYRPLREVNVGYGIANPPTYHADMHEAFLKSCPDLKGAPYILFLSRIHEKKGVDILIQAYLNTALKWMDKSGPAPLKPLSMRGKGESPLIPKLVIAGPGVESAYGRKLQQLARQNDKLRNHIVFPGMLTGNVKWGAFYGCEAFILPSHQENFGIAVVEALACCRPVLITNKVNIWKEIQEEGAGMVAKDTLTDVQEMIDSWYTMTYLEKSAMGRRARAVFDKKFSIGLVANRLIEAING